MASASVTLGGAVTGLPNGSQTISAQWTSIAAVGEVLPVILQSGANTIAIPTGTTLVVMIPPPTNVVALTLKGVSGDTGIPLNPNAPNCFSPLAGTTSFVVNAASLTVGPTLFNFV